MVTFPSLDHFSFFPASSWDFTLLYLSYDYIIQLKKKTKTLSAFQVNKYFLKGKHDMWLLIQLVSWEKQRNMVQVSPATQGDVDGAPGFALL